MITIAITGGIGSGKSVVSSILEAMGYDIYNCDCRAKILMDRSPIIKDRISDLISPEAITATNKINRQLLAKMVFNDSQKLQVLNKIVHSEVINDFKLWRTSLNRNICWIETAILYESGINKLVDYIWEIKAPVDIRINRVMCRNNLSKEDVISRINSQKTYSQRESAIYIINDDKTPILPQIENLLKVSGI